MSKEGEHVDEVDPTRVHLSFRARTSLIGADDEASRGLSFWSVGIELVDEENGDVERRIGNARAVIVDSLCPDPWDACDEDSGDLLALAAALWTRDGELTAEVEQVVEYLGQDVLLLDRIHLEPAVRGHDIGLLCATEIIRVLGRGCGVVATQAMPPHDDEVSEFERKRGSALLIKHWARLGLEVIPGHAKDGMLVGDLTKTGIGEARESIRSDQGLG